jgi:hypothetical protein
VCGFRVGATAVILDGRGRFDLFSVAAADATLHAVASAAPLTAAYPAGAVLVEVEANRFELMAQADGSRSLVRRTVDGATQPLVDGVVGMGVEPWGEASAPRISWDGVSGWASYGPAPPPPSSVDPQHVLADGETCVSVYVADTPRSRLRDRGEAGALVRIEPADLTDGPWCPGGTSGVGYDADLFRLRRVDLWLHVEALSASLRGPAGRLFSRGGSAAHAPLRWVPDRRVTVSATLRNAP